MAKKQYIELKLNVEHNKHNINAILEKGHTLGCIYFNWFERFKREDCAALPVNEAVQELFKAYQEKAKPQELVTPSIFVKVEDIFFDLYFYKDKEDLLTIRLNTMANVWVKEFFDEEFETDFARYIRLLLKITDNFILRELITVVEYS